MEDFNMSKKLNENNVAVNVVNKEESNAKKRCANIDTLKKDFATYKSIKNVVLVTDYIKESEKSGAMLNELGQQSTRKSLNKYELVHVWSGDNTNKQYFYIRVSTNGFKFVVNPKISNALQSLKGFKDKKYTVRFATHKHDNLYYVDVKNGAKLIKLVYDAMQTLTVKTETTVKADTTVKAETETTKAE